MCCVNAVLYHIYDRTTLTKRKLELDFIVANKFPVCMVPSLMIIDSTDELDGLYVATQINVHA